MRRLLNVPVAERLPVVAPDGVLDDADQEVVAIRGQPRRVSPKRG